MHRGVTQSRRIDGALDAARFARHPIFYFDLAPILERSGSSLLRGPERLEAMCQHGLAHLTETDLTLFDPAGFYLIVGSCAGAQAEALANRVNIALLKLFFGTDSLSPDQLMTLFRTASPGEISDGDPTLMDRAAQIISSASIERKKTTPQDTHADSPYGRFSEVAERGFHAASRTSLCFAPAYDLKRDVPALFVCMAMAAREGRAVYGRAAFGEIDPDHMPQLDAAILHYAVQFSERLAQTGSTIAVTAPVSVETLGWSRGRSIYQKVLQHSDTFRHPQIVPTLADVPAGVPPATLADMMRTLRPFARRTAVALPQPEMPLQGSGLIGASGYILALPRRSDAVGATRAAQWLGRFSAAQSAFSCLLDINSEEALDAAKGAGIRFGAGTALAPRALTGESAIEYAKLLAHTPPPPRET